MTKLNEQFGVIETLVGFDHAKTFSDLISKLEAAYWDGIKLSPTLAFASIWRRRSCGVSKSKLAACHASVKTSLGVSILDDDSPFPDAESFRLSPLLQLVPSERILQPLWRLVPSILGQKPHSPGWIQDISSAAWDRYTYHYLYRIPRGCDHLSMGALSEELSNFYEDKLLKDPFSPILAPSSGALCCRGQASYGVTVLAFASATPEPGEVRSSQNIDFFYAGSICDLTPEIWLTAEGLRRSEKIRTHANCLQKLHGVYLWCCPFDQRIGNLHDGTDIPLDGPVANLNSTRGRLAIYEPLLADLQKIMPSSHDPDFAIWQQSFENISHAAFAI